MPDASEQRRQRRAVAGVLAGALVLGAVGVAGAILVTSGPCEDLLPPGPAPEAVADGAEVLAAVAPDADLPALAADVVAVGERLGLGPVRGATPAPPEVTALPFDDGSFVVTDRDDVRIIDTAIIAVATGREHRADVSVRPAADQVGVVVSEGGLDTLIARYDGDLKLTACRELDRPDPGRPPVGWGGGPVGRSRRRRRPARRRVAVAGTGRPDRSRAPTPP